MVRAENPVGGSRFNMQDFFQTTNIEMCIWYTKKGKYLLSPILRNWLQDLPTDSFRNLWERLYKEALKTEIQVHWNSNLNHEEMAGHC